MIPINVEDLQENVLERSDKRSRSFSVFLFGCVAWCLWLARNYFVFNNIVISFPNVFSLPYYIIHAEIAVS
jgi:hypothetical protein